jgi:hypothetical protein
MVVLWPRGINVAIWYCVLSFGTIMAYIFSSFFRFGNIYEEKSGIP